MASNSVACKPSFDELNKLNVTKQLEIMQNLYTLWEEVGIDEEQELHRATQVWNDIFEVLYETFHDEDNLVKEIKERVKNYAKKISVLNAELQLPKAEEFTGSLIEQEIALRHLMDEMSKMKHRRLRNFYELCLQGLKYSEVLGVTPFSFKFSSPTGVPSEKDIQEIQQEVKTLQEEKEKRQQEFYKLKKELSTILEVTEQSPDIPFEKVYDDEEGKLSLSIEKLQQLKQIVTETKKKQSDLENEKLSLMEKLSLLWDNLEINANERELFLSKYTDCRTSTLNALKEEIARCKEIKKLNFSKQVFSLKEELKSLWKKCFVVPSDNMFLQFQEDEISETVFENYSNELQKWKMYCKDIEHIIQMIAKRKELWDQITVFEAADPNRFKNRGGNLLKEEKERKHLQKSLPELEKKIISHIQNYEKETGKQFLYYGEKFEDFMKKQWEDRLNQKENEKLSKKKMRLEELRTPSKQAFSIRTPKSTPSTVLRSVGSIFKTPNFSVSKQSSRTPISRLKNEKEATNIAKRPKRSILKEKNRNKLASENLDSTTYADFASKLNRSSRIYHRSSVVSSKMTAQTRASLNKNGKATRKSLRKK